MDINYNQPRRQKIAIKKLPRLPDEATAEQRYWNTFKNPIINKYPSAVNAINFCPIEPHDFVAACGTVLYIYDPLTNESKKSISQFKQTIRCATFRPDGKLLAAGGDDRKVQIFDVKTRGILRQFRDHKGSVQDVQFLVDNDTQLVSVSEDKMVRLFDIPTEKLIHTFVGHEDYVRCVRVNPKSPNVIATASYDHTVKLWDVRSQETIASFEHGYPVEKLEFFPSGGAIAAAVGNGIVLRDIVTGKEIAQLTNHQKTTTSLCFDGTGTRLFSASLDHQVKIYDLDTYHVSHSIKYASPILDLGISKNNSHLVVGMSDGTMSIRRRELKKSDGDADSTPRYHSATHRHMGDTKDDASSLEHPMLPSKGGIMQPYERLLRKYLFKEALDFVLAKSDVILTVSLLEDLAIRCAVGLALEGRNNQELLPVLNFLHKNILNPRYNTHLFSVFEIILDKYAAVLGRAPEVDELVLNIHLKLKNELNLQEQMFKLAGALEMVMTTTGLHN